MNILMGIFTLLLISSNTVLCGRIRRKEPEAPTWNEFSDLSKLKDENFRETNADLKLRMFSTTTPTNYEIVEKSSSVSGETESGGNAVTENYGKFESPLSAERIEKMLKKAIIKIITGDLTIDDMELLKSLNYNKEEVLRIRKQEMAKMKREMMERSETAKKIKLGNQLESIDKNKMKNFENSMGGIIDYEAYNNKATDDYENTASIFESNLRLSNDSYLDFDDVTISSTEVQPEPKPIGKPRIVFKLSYNDSEFDSSSEEGPVISRKENHQSALNGTGNNFPAAVTSVNSSPASVDRMIVSNRELWNFTANYFTTTASPVEMDNDVGEYNVVSSRKRNVVIESRTDILRSSERTPRFDDSLNGNENSTESSPSLSTAPFSTTETPSSSPEENESTTSAVTHRQYKGLKWIQDNVYQVIPKYIDSLESGNLETENDTLDSLFNAAVYQNLENVAFKNLTTAGDPVPVEEGMQNVASDSTQVFRSSPNVSMDDFINLTAHQQIIATQRQAQRQKIMEDIKKIVLVFTGRSNTTINSKPVQPHEEKMTMFSPTCEIPRNTDTEAWQDLYSINMQFQPNLTSDQHLVAAKLRLFKLPQENLTSTASTDLDGLEEEEKKIRISVYVYTKPLRKNRSKKFLMDSIMVSLTTTGAHLALDVKDSSRYWRPSSRNASRNHGLVVLVEDQDGRPLQPARYIQTPNCPNTTNMDEEDQKAYRVPALFIRACARYVRIVNDGLVTYEDCRPQTRGISNNDQETSPRY